MGFLLEVTVSWYVPKGVSKELSVVKSGTERGRDFKGERGLDSEVREYNRYGLGVE